MGKRATVLGLVLCVLLFTLADRSFSRARGPQTPAEQQRWLQEQQRKTEQRRSENQEKQKAAQKQARQVYEEYSDQAWQEALSATPEQWQAIKPKLEQVRKSERSPTILLSVYGFSGGGDSYSDSYSNVSGSSGGAGVSGGSVTGGAGGSGGFGGGAYSAGGGSGAGPIGPPSGARAPGGASGGGGSFSSGGSAGSSAGYGFGFGGPPGPVKKKVGEMSLGWQWRRPSLNKDAGQLSENDKTCEQLLDVLESQSPDPAQVRQRIEALRKVREQIQAKRQEARQQLRAVVTPEQEAKLILMGYLD